jgi:KTSC domain
MPSTVIRSFDYDEARRELHVLFRSGKRYIYQDVPPEIFVRMKASFSKGEFFNEHVRDRFAFVRDTSSEE